MLMGSFLPAGGALLSVKVHPSDYGLERLKVTMKFNADE